MKTWYYCLLLSLILSFPTNSTLAQTTEASNDHLTEIQKAFAPLVGKTWHAEGNWENGKAFKQTIAFSWGLEQKAVVTRTQGFIDAEQTQWGERNHGIRYYDFEQDMPIFMEIDVFGGFTSGLAECIEENIYYRYEYGGNALTDAWEMVDEDTYNFTVGTQRAGKWETIYLKTQFVAETPNDEIMMPTDMSLPYRQIPEYPEAYNASTVAARMVDGLGFRYYWATEGLRQEDLDYRTTPESRTSAETIDHIFGLVNVVHNAVMEKPNIRGGEREELTYAEKRARTLQLIAATSEKLKSSDAADMERFDIIFQRGDQSTEYPFWNNLNGPLADAIWHVGQVVAFRRASGNPFNSKVSVLRGKVRE